MNRPQTDLADVEIILLVSLTSRLLHIFKLWSPKGGNNIDLTVKIIRQQYHKLPLMIAQIYYSKKTTGQIVQTQTEVYILGCSCFSVLAEGSDLIIPGVWVPRFADGEQRRSHHGQGFGSLVACQLSTLRDRRWAQCQPATWYVWVNLVIGEKHG